MKMSFFVHLPVRPAVLPFAILCNISVFLDTFISNTVFFLRQKNEHYFDIFMFKINVFYLLLKK